ncbi:hypothetical protein E2C01_055438 [Portunus trituberculatus]|uniref:Secreted protein n=1 Tax=Portunus trituberculatus TaxID=210409 RepID=A0A5B7GWU2_PORTR|nr:hypothetical protein [Portunus trituberculatus]
MINDRNTFNNLMFNSSHILMFLCSSFPWVLIGAAGGQNARLAVPELNSTCASGKLFLDPGLVVCWFCPHAVHALTAQWRLGLMFYLQPSREVPAACLVCRTKPRQPEEQ